MIEISQILPRHRRSDLPCLSSKISFKYLGLFGFQRNSPKAVSPVLNCCLNCFIIFDLGAVPHAGLDICHRPPKMRGTERAPSWNVSISVVPFVKAGSGTGAIADKVGTTAELLL
jgi:hypothetical protein